MKVTLTLEPLKGSQRPLGFPRPHFENHQRDDCREKGQNAGGLSPPWPISCEVLGSPPSPTEAPVCSVEVVHISPQLDCSLGLAASLFLEVLSQWQALRRGVMETLISPLPPHSCSLCWLLLGLCASSLPLHVIGLPLQLSRGQLVLVGFPQPSNKSHSPLLLSVSCAIPTDALLSGNTPFWGVKREKMDRMRNGGNSTSVKGMRGLSGLQRTFPDSPHELRDSSSEKPERDSGPRLVVEEPGWARTGLPQPHQGEDGLVLWLAPGPG